MPTQSRRERRYWLADPSLGSSRRGSRLLQLKLAPCRKTALRRASPQGGCTSWDIAPPSLRSLASSGGAARKLALLPLLLLLLLQTAVTPRLRCLASLRLALTPRHALALTQAVVTAA
jgi:hypothetical protein